MLSETAKKARAEYMREYRKKNKERIRKQNAEWRKNNPEKLKAAQDRFWSKKAREMGISQ